MNELITALNALPRIAAALEALVAHTERLPLSDAGENETAANDAAKPAGKGKGKGKGKTDAADATTPVIPTMPPAGLGAPLGAAPLPSSAAPAPLGGAAGLNTAPGGVVQPPMGGAPGVPMGSPSVDAGMQPPAWTAAPPQPPAAPPPMQHSPTDAWLAQAQGPFANLDAQGQFTQIAQMFSRGASVPAVVDALTTTAHANNCPLPMSDQADRSRPSAAFCELPVQARWNLFAAVTRAVFAATAN